MSITSLRVRLVHSRKRRVLRRIKGNGPSNPLWRMFSGQWMPEEGEQDGDGSHQRSHGCEHHTDLRSLMPGDQVCGQTLENALKLRGALSGIILSIGHGRDLLEGILVNASTKFSASKTEPSTKRVPLEAGSAVHHSSVRRTESDGVNSHSAVRGLLRCIQRSEEHTSELQS